jgi:drug/metabolite transporter (DMT)-like permease
MSISMNYLLVLAVWSTTPLAIVWSSESFEPMAAGGLRLLIALVVILAMRPLLSVPALEFGRHWKAYAVSAIGLYPGLALVYWAAPLLPSSLISVIFGLAPFFVMGINALVFGQREVTAGQVLAVGIAFIGLTVLLNSEDSGDHFSYLGLLLILLAVTFYALSTLLVKAHAMEMHVLNLLSGSLMMATPLYLMTWLLGGGHLPVAPSLKAILAVLYLALIGSVFAYISYFYLLKRLSATVVSFIPMITPAIALILGITLNGEHLSRQMLAGMMMIMLGIWIYQYLGSRKIRPQAPVSSNN